LLACATVWRNVIVFLHNISIYVAICIYAGVSVSWATLLALPGLILVCVNGIWIGLLLGAVCARYRDVQQLVSSLLQISLFLTPIFWSVDQLKGRASILAELNPLYHIISVVRDPLMGHAPQSFTWLVVGLISGVGWTFTIIVMAKLRHRIVYWV
jgi:ABC-type polysaccharide/polyol phosphate export permease